jgi:hypothetical protein
VRRQGTALLASAACLLSGAVASARVDFEITYTDAAGEGFFDDTVRAPLSDNPGTSLGEQRRWAFEYAVAVWARALHSPVAVRIEATFAPPTELLCDERGAVLGAARAQSAFAGFSGALRDDIFYPSALADKLAGVDLDPGEPDISAMFNPRLDDANCLADSGWNYDPLYIEEQVGFVTTVLHELTHGLGFASLVDELTGAEGDGVSIFETKMFDNTLGLTWDTMTASERRQSASTPLGLSWIGEHVTQAATMILAAGQPALSIAGEQSAMLLAEPSFEPWLSTSGVSAELISLDAEEACEGQQSLAGKIALLQIGPACEDLVLQLERVSARGAAAALTRSTLSGLPPWGVTGSPRAPVVPSLSLSQPDFDALLARMQSGTSLLATLRAGAARLGMDNAGHVLLSANDPVLAGSSASHWDTSTRRQQQKPSDPINLLMEPAEGGLLRHEVGDLTVQLLQDLGWDQGETANSNDSSAPRSEDGGATDGDRPKVSAEDPGCACRTGVHPRRGLNPAFGLLLLLLGLRRGHRPLNAWTAH